MDEEKNNVLEARIQKDVNPDVRIQLLDGHSCISSGRALATPHTLCWFGRGFGREIRRLKGSSASEGADYIVTNVMVEQNLYEAFKQGVNEGVQERQNPDRYLNQADQGLPAWYKTLARM